MVGVIPMSGLSSDVRNAPTMQTLQAELQECRRANVGLKKMLTHRPGSLLLAQSTVS